MKFSKMDNHRMKGGKWGERFNIESNKLKCKRKNGTS